MMSIKENLIKLGNQAVSILYPPCCPICGKIISQGFFVCPSCRKELPWIRGSICLICGRNVPEGEPLCGDCLDRAHDFDICRAMCLYDDRMRQVLSELKYHHRRDIGTALGKLLAEYGRELVRAWEIDMIVPVPVHKSRLKKRGYNQAAVVAGECARLWQLPVNERAVVRKRKTKAMKELDRRERADSLRQAFESGPSPVMGRRVLVIDDIYTTGSTLDAVSHVLKENGARFAAGLIICIGNGIVLK